jgi:hypothetical protein
MSNNNNTVYTAENSKPSHHPTLNEKCITHLATPISYTVDFRVSGLMWRKGRPDNKKAG